jgi:hypothetical protein
MKLISCAFLVTAFCTACTKKELSPSSNSISSSAENNLSISRARSALLASQPWIYKSLYFHYIDQNQKGDPQYVRGASNNILDLDETKYTFKKNGTFVELDGGYAYPGTWKFSDSTASLLLLDFTYWNEKHSILILNKNLLSYTQTHNYTRKNYTELVAAP